MFLVPWSLFSHRREVKKTSEILCRSATIGCGLAGALKFLGSLVVVARWIGFWVLSSSVWAGVKQEGSQTATTRPNVVLILADDLGFADIGCYGGEIATEHLDRLATRGVRLTQFYNAARCWPTRASLLTGYYPQQVRRDSVELVSKSLQGKRPTWAPLVSVRLRSLGYRCFVSGKWHIDGDPAVNGFDRSFLIEDHDRFFSPNRMMLDGQPLPQISPDQSFYATTAIADRALEFLSEHRSYFSDKPFFLYLAFTAPHFPLQAKPEDVARYRSRYDQGWDEVRMQRWRRQVQLGFLLPEPAPLETEVGPLIDSRT